MLAGPSQALAHAQLLGTSPTSGATVPAQPAQVIFKFNQAVGGTLGAVRVYDARSGKQVAENRDFLLEPLAVDFDSDGRQVVAGGGDKIVAFIDAGSGKLIRRLQKTDEPVSNYSLKVSPDGSLVAAILMKAENMTQPAPVVVWEVSSGQRKFEWMPTTLALDMDWTRDGRLISAGADADSLHIWRVP